MPLKFLKAKMLVVGGGNVAMDAARCAMRMGAEKGLHSIQTFNRRNSRKSRGNSSRYRRRIDFQLLRNPVRILGDEDGHVTGLECVEDGGAGRT